MRETSALEDSAASVDDEVLAGHVGACVGTEEEDGALVLVLVSHAGHGDEGVELGGEVFGLRGEDTAGADGVAADVVGCPVGGEIAGEADEGVA